MSSITSELISNANHFNATWFRGQSNYEYSLMPSVFRQGESYQLEYNEQKMFDEFKRRYPNQSTSHKTTYEWLTLMQHYGLPTRLLDWTSNLLVALYFTCVDDQEKDGSLFVYDPTYMERDFKFNELLEMQVQEKTRSDFFNRLIYKMPEIINDEALLNGLSISHLKSDILACSKFTGLSTGSKEEFKSLALKQNLTNIVDESGSEINYIYQDILRAFSNIVPFKSPHLNPRIRQQHGCFTLHGGMYIDGQEFIKIEKMEEHPYSENTLLKFKILAKDKSKLLKELEYSGIREATLFPEMEYQAKEIRLEYTTKQNL